MNICEGQKMQTSECERGQDGRLIKDEDIIAEQENRGTETLSLISFGISVLAVVISLIILVIKLRSLQ